MANKSKEVTQKEVVQAVLVADNFRDDFVPITTDTPLALLPLLNVPLIDYTLEFLSLAGIEETFLFCCSKVDAINEHVRKSIANAARWSVRMKVNVIVSESCRSFGDCLRDLDAKGLLRNVFVLLEPGVVGNIKLLPIIKKHNEICKIDKGAAMTLILQEAGVGQAARCGFEDFVLASTSNNRVVFHQKLKPNIRKIDLPLEILVDNPSVTILNNLKDTHIAICSASVLPLFSDNFDFQTKDDFVRGLLMNEEILGSTVYWHPIKDMQYASAIMNWKMYQTVSRDILHRWTYPLVPDMGISTQEQKYVHLKNNIYKNKTVQLAKSSSIEEDVIIGSDSFVSDRSRITRSIIGDKVKIGKDVVIEDSFVFSNTAISDKCVIKYSIIGSDCKIQPNSKIVTASILGKGVSLPENCSISKSLIQSHAPKEARAIEKLSKEAFKIKYVGDDDDSNSEEGGLVEQMSRLRTDSDEFDEFDGESEDDFSKSDDEMSYTHSPVPDDTNLFLSEVIDSLARGFEDKLQCDNLILEINSSRYAYNVTVKEVNFNVIKAVLTLPFQLCSGQPYLHSLRPLLAYFSPILKNYIRNDAAMTDCLLAIEDIAAANNELNECVAAVLNWFYDKDHLSEEAILSWFTGLDRNTRLYARIQPFANWLKEAEEASSEDEE